MTSWPVGAKGSLAMKMHVSLLKSFSYLISCSILGRSNRVISVQSEREYEVER